jgi:hypothetical protein
MMTTHSRLISLSLLSGCLIFLHGCQSMKKNLGMEREAPDEFAVTPCSQPLDMPPDFFALPVPQPGMPRPQEVKAMKAKQEKLFGVETKPGTQSSSEKVLLEKAGSAKAEKDIRKQVDEESHIESPDKTVLEKLGIKKSQPKGDIINAEEEVQTLEEKGIPHTPKVIAE